MKKTRRYNLDRRDIVWSSPKLINYDGKKITLDIEIQTFYEKNKGV